MTEAGTGNTGNEVKGFWESASCGEVLYLPGTDRGDYERQALERYRLEPYIPPFADFNSTAGLRVLEIGIGLGADHQRFAEAGADLTGIDVTDRAIEHVRKRFTVFDLRSELHTANAEALPFADASFDLVYSWGVLHHTPDTPAAINEVHRVLAPGGEARIMIYHKHSLVGYMLWARYALARGRLRTPLADIYAEHLESPGTKAYTLDEARALYAGFDILDLRTQLTHADLLASPVGQRHRGRALSLARAVWPRWLIRRLLPRHGLFLLARVRRPRTDA
jgi:SAM-dependent methyltransferase